MAGGGFKHGQHLAFDPKDPPPLCNLYVSMLQRLGIEADRFGSSTGRLRGWRRRGNELACSRRNKRFGVRRGIAALVFWVSRTEGGPAVAERKRGNQSGDASPHSRKEGEADVGRT